MFNAELWFLRSQDKPNTKHRGRSFVILNVFRAPYFAIFSLRQFLSLDNWVQQIYSCTSLNSGIYSFRMQATDVGVLKQSSDDLYVQVVYLSFQFIHEFIYSSLIVIHALGLFKKRSSQYLELCIFARFLPDDTKTCC